MTTTTTPGVPQLDQMAELQVRLAEAEAALLAIRSGEVDAITVTTPAGERVYALHGADLPYRVMIEAMNEGAVTISPAGMVLYCNRSFANLTRSDPASIIGSSLMLHFADRDREIIAQALHKEQGSNTRIRASLRTVDGAFAPVSVAMHIPANEDIPNIIVVTSDLTQAVAAQDAATEINKRLEQANRSLHMLNACHSVIIRATEEQRLLAEMCSILVGLGGYALSWIGYVEHDEAKSVRPAAWTDGEGDGDYVETAAVSWGDSERGRGPCGRAIRSGQTTVMRDTATDPTFEPWRALAQGEGLRSSAAMPLRDGQAVFGVLAVYSGRPDAFDTQEQALLTELADDVAYCVTNLRREAKLVETRAFLDNILQSSTKYSIISEDLDRRILFWNEGARRNYGYTPEEVIGQPEHFLETPEDLASGAIDRLADTARTAGIAEGELLRARKDGTQFPASVVVTRRNDAAGNPVGYLVISSDISEKRQAEAALKESADAFRNLTDTMPQMVWTASPEGLNTYCNRQWIIYTGLTLEESYGRGWNTPFHPDDKQAAWDAWNHSTQSGETYRIESRLRAADGTYRWFLMKGTPVQDSAGRITKWFGTCTDIDELKRAEEKLRAASQYARSLLEANLDPMVTIGPDGAITDVNHGTELITGRRRDQLIGTDFAICFTDPERARAGYRKVFLRGFLLDYALTIRHVAGTVTAVSCNASLYYDADGAVGGVFLAARDMSRVSPADGRPEARRPWGVWRYLGYAVAALLAYGAIAQTSSLVLDWLHHEQQQAGIVRSIATNARMRSLLEEVTPTPARIRVAQVKNQGSGGALSFVATYAIASANHNYGIQGNETPLTRFANELPALQAGDCVLLKQQLNEQNPERARIIACPISGNPHWPIGLVTVSWDKGDPLPADFDLAMAATKRAAVDIAKIWADGPR